MVKIIRDLQPKYLIPVHFRPSEGNLLVAEYGFPSPSDPEKDIEQLRKNLKAQNLMTKIIILKPGIPLELTGK